MTHTLSLTGRWHRLYQHPGRHFMPLCPPTHLYKRSTSPLSMSSCEALPWGSLIRRGSTSSQRASGPRTASCTRGGERRGGPGWHVNH